MAEHTFLTELELTKRLGVVTDVEYDDDTVDIPTRNEIREIAKAAMSSEMKKVLKTAEAATEKAKAATADAAAARELVEKFVETARETFRDVVEELLAPHYRRLAELSGIEPLHPKISLEKAKGSTTNAKPRKTTKSKEEKEFTSTKVKPKRLSRTKAGNDAGATKSKANSKSSRPARTRMAKQ